MRFLFVSLLLLLAACAPAPTENNAERTPDAAANDSLALLEAQDAVLTDLFENNAPSVVNVRVEFFETDPPRETLIGSGFVLDAQGHIATNAALINPAAQFRGTVSVTFNDGYLTQAEIVGIDTFSDIAVLRVQVENARLRSLRFGDSDSLRTGQRVVIIGNPFGLSGSLTLGMIGGLGRQLPSAQLIDAGAIPGFQNPSILQLDAMIPPGSAGAPVLNLRGEVVGMTTALGEGSVALRGISFAVPVSTIARVAPELIAEGVVSYSYIGITTQAEEDGFTVAALAEPLNLPVTAGVLIRAVAPNSPAAEAGLRGGNRIVRVRNTEVCAGGDVIVAVNDVYIQTMSEFLTYLILKTRPGDTVRLTVVRQGETLQIPVTLSARPISGDAPSNVCQVESDE